MTVDGFFPALSAVFYALFLVAGVYIYAALIRQIAARAPASEPPPLRTFGWPEALLAVFLAAFFLLSVSSGSTRSPSRIGNRELIASAAFTVGLLLAVAGFLRLRRFDLDSLGGFSKIGFFRTAITAGIFILAAYPLILLADVATQRILQGAPPPLQPIVEMFNESSTLEKRILIIVIAVSLAPLAEEFIFRFFIYGVMKRYLGRGVAVVASALLFAAVHAHLPSFAPLFVLGSCLAVAYEWSGSILVPMTMHALFNAVTLTALAFQDTSQP
jgi:membrane protease YdiL (CAAX protease family)